MLSAVTTAQVGTQVSGLIAELFADFNDRVEKGQIIARLDTTLLESNLRDVQASLEHGASNSRPQPSMLFYLKDGELAMMPARPGITAGQFTEVRGPLLEEGMQVIAGMSRGVQPRSRNPFQANQPSGPRPFGGF